MEHVLANNCWKTSGLHTDPAVNGYIQMLRFNKLLISGVTPTARIVNITSIARTVKWTELK